MRILNDSFKIIFLGVPNNQFKSLFGDMEFRMNDFILDLLSYF